MTDQPRPDSAPPPLPSGCREPDPGQPAGRNHGQPHYAPPPPPSRGTGRVFLSSCLAAGCATLLAPLLLVAGMVVIIVSLASVDIPGSVAAPFSGISGEFQERVLREGGAGRGTIAILTLHGGIDGSGSGLEGSGSLALISGQLRAALENDGVKAVLLQIDSPGGGLTPSDMLHNEVMKVRAGGKIVVAWAGGLMASGGYYVAAGADGIMASPTASVGSIGVIMQRFQVDGLMEMLGLRADPVMAGSSKDIGSPFRDMTPEERAVFQDAVDRAHERFIGIVAKGRGLPEAEVAKLADGKLFTADACVANGLVDKIGYIDEAIAWTEELAGERDMRVIAYRRIFSFSDFWAAPGRSAARFFERLLTGTDCRPLLLAEWRG